jgi:FAD/FMN-containing dehydrogenase
VGKVAEYLRSHLDGEVSDSSDVREHFSTDAGLVKQAPQTVVYPYSEQDVRKVARFSWQLAEKGKKVAITGRGLGSDWSGGAVGESLIVAMPTHMNKILELDSRKGQVVLEAGATMGKVSQTLVTHGLFLPYEPLSSEFSTVGGAVATNSNGLRSAKYGSIGKNINSLKVVLSSGELVKTERISKRELKKKMGQATFEGEIYRGIDAILNDSADLVASFSGVSEHLPINICDVRHKDGSVDLTPLFVGSQGTLGLITSVDVKASAYNPALCQAIVGFASQEDFYASAAEISKLSPSIFTVVEKPTLQIFGALQPMYVAKQFGEQSPEIMVLLEFDDFSTRSRKKASRRLRKMCAKINASITFATSEKNKEDISKFFRMFSILMQTEFDKTVAVPGLDSSFVHIDSYRDVSAKATEVFAKSGTRYVSWYDYQTGVLRYFPFIDLRTMGGKQKLMSIIDQVSRVIIAGKGVVGIQGGGRLAAQYHREMCGDVLYDVLLKVKALFDPYNVLNPGVVFNVDPKVNAAKMVASYSQAHRHNHLPR